MRRKVLVLIAAGAVALGGAAHALGGGRGVIWDDGRPVQPGSLDDGKDLLPQTRISLAAAVAAAKHAAQGRLGQVDLERWNGRVVYKVDVGDREVRVDAGDSSVVSTTPQS